MSIAQNTQVIISLSGWVDSTTVLFLCIAYFKDQWLDTNNISILHYNHKQRQESEYEEQHIQNFIHSLWIKYIWSSYNSQYWSSENNLRKGRKHFFDSYLMIIWEENTVFLSWHHLDDRIETTLLNRKRWTWKRWEKNMSIFKKCFIRDDLGRFLQYVYFRPLIDVYKLQIREIALKYGLVTFEDSTNTDENISLRNKIRKENQELLSQEYYIQRREYYKKYDISKDIRESKNPSIRYIELSKNIWPIQTYYKFPKLTTIEHLQDLLDFLWIYRWISSNFLTEMENFLSKKTWYKYFKWWYFFHSYWSLYVIEAEQTFREQDFMFPLEKTHPNSLIRKNILWDQFRWKRFKKFLGNQKIPFFLRNYIPVEVLDGKVVNTLFNKDLKELKVM